MLSPVGQTASAQTKQDCNVCSHLERRIEWTGDLHEKQTRANRGRLR